jgi:hypothetical protein
LKGVISILRELIQEASTQPVYLWPSLITGGAGLLGAIIGGTISYFANRYLSKQQYQQREEDYRRNKRLPYYVELAEMASQALLYYETIKKHDLSSFTVKVDDVKSILDQIVARRTDNLSDDEYNDLKSKLDSVGSMQGYMKSEHGIIIENAETFKELRDKIESMFKKKWGEFSIFSSQLVIDKATTFFLDLLSTSPANIPPEHVFKNATELLKQIRKEIG